MIKNVTKDPGIWWSVICGGKFSIKSLLLISWILWKILIWECHGGSFVEKTSTFINVNFFVHKWPEVDKILSWEYISSRIKWGNIFFAILSKKISFGEEIFKKYLLENYFFKSENTFLKYITANRGVNFWIFSRFLFTFDAAQYSRLVDFLSTIHR